MKQCARCRSYTIHVETVEGQTVCADAARCLAALRISHALDLICATPEPARMEEAA